MLITQSEGKFLKRKNSINLNGKLIEFTDPVVMGIINVTPDSFYDGGKLTNKKVLLSAVDSMVKEGVSIIDVGGMSTRPGAEMVSTKVELERLIPAVQAIRKNHPEIPISIDTFRSWVAVRIIEEIGPIIVNDISGGTLDSKMFETVGKINVPYILTHIQGTPQSMQEEPHYTDVVKEVSSWLSDRVKLLTKLGVNDVIIDPGFGFGKNLTHNFELLNRLDSLKVFQLPVMVGLSRKSMLWQKLNIKPEEALNATTAANTMALLGGADILRVHDVKEAKEAIEIVKALKQTVI